MFRKKQRGKMSILRSWKVFGISLLLLFTAVFMLIFSISYHMYKKEVTSSNQYMIEHTKMLLDKILEDTQQASSVLWLDNEMAELFKIGQVPTDADYAYVNQIIKKMNQVRATNDMIESIFIVDAEKDRVFSDAGNYGYENVL